MDMQKVDAPKFPRQWQRLSMKTESDRHGIDSALKRLAEAPAPEGKAYAQARQRFVVRMGATLSTLGERTLATWLDIGRDFYRFRQTCRTDRDFLRNFKDHRDPYPDHLQLHSKTVQKLIRVYLYTVEHPKLPLAKLPQSIDVMDDLIRAEKAERINIAQAADEGRFSASATRETVRALLHPERVRSGRTGADDPQDGPPLGPVTYEDFDVALDRTISSYMHAGGSRDAVARKLRAKLEEIETQTEEEDN